MVLWKRKKQKSTGENRDRKNNEIKGPNSRKEVDDELWMRKLATPEAPTGNLDEGESLENIASAVLGEETEEK